MTTHSRRHSFGLNSGPSSRGLLVTGIALLVSTISTGCSGPAAPDDSIGGDNADQLSSRLSARPGTPSRPAVKGFTTLGLDPLRDGFMFVPQCYASGTPTPLVVALHGSQSSSAFWAQYEQRAEDRCFAMLAPDSRAATWDLAEGRLGPDIAFIDRALEHVFDRVNVDPSRIVLLGFSDGASYAISIGVSNGDLFHHLVAHSSGFFIPFEPLVGKPAIYISHGLNDPILPIATVRDLIVPNFEQAGYEVTYREFDGGHQIPDAVAEEALDWWLGTPTTRFEPSRGAARAVRPPRTPAGR